MTFNEIVGDVLSLCSQSEGGDFETMAKAGVNRAYRRALSRVDQDHQFREFSLSTVASTSKYGMPLYVKRVMNIENAAQRRRIFDISSKEFDVKHPGTTAEGEPLSGYILGRFGVQVQPAAASTVSVVSDNSGDAGDAYRLRTTGFSSSQLQTEQITVNGTSAVASSNSYDINGIERLVKEVSGTSSFTGTLTVKDSSANVLATIPPSWTSPTYLWMELYPIPDAVYSLTVRAVMYKPDLINDGDWPEVDEDYHNALVWGAAAELLPMVGKSTMGRQMMAQWENSLKEIQATQGRRPNRVHVMADTHNFPVLPRRPLIPKVDL